AQALLIKVEKDIQNYSESDKDKIMAAYLAQKSVIALVRNEKDKSRELARNAQKSYPASRAALLSSAYIAQADTDLDSATAWLKELVANNPNQAFAYAKLAELELGKGDFKEAE